jgi:dTDP-4-dehydrorhamnose reductase
MNSIRKKLLITGGSGFLGWNLCRAAKESWEVFGTVFSHKTDIPGCRKVCVDITNYNALTKIFNEIKPDAVIHTAAESQPNYCQNNPYETYTINVQATISIAGLCADKNIPLAFTSSDLVFDGLNPPYSEKDPVSPVNTYGEQKVKAEIEIAKRYPRAAICRMPLMFGDPSPASNSFLQPILSNLKNGKQTTLFTDEYRTPASALTAAKGLLWAVDNFSGTIHLGGKERVSRFEFGIKVAEYCGFDKALIKPIFQKSISMPAPRSPDVSLDSSKAFKMGYSPLPLVEEFKCLSFMKKNSLEK